QNPAETLELFGADLVAEEDLARYRVRLATGRKEASDALVHVDSVFITEQLANGSGLGLGDELNVSTPSGVKKLKIAGLLEPEGWSLALGGQLAVADIAAAQTWLGKVGRVDQIDVVLREGADVEAAKTRLSAALPATLNVLRPAEHGMQYEAVLSSFRAMLTGLSTLCLIAGLFIVYNAASTAALHRSAV